VGIGENTKDVVTLTMTGDRGPIDIPRGYFEVEYEDAEPGLPGIDAYGLPPVPARPFCLLRFGSPEGETVFVYGTKAEIEAKLSS
jgi:hypothetical protein